MQAKAAVTNPANVVQHQQLLKQQKQKTQGPKISSAFVVAKSTTARRNRSLATLHWRHGEGTVTPSWVCLRLGPSGQPTL